MSDKRSMFAIPVVRELLIILLIKLALIITIKWLFFSTPVVLDHQSDVSQQLGLCHASPCSVPAASFPVSNPASQQEDLHDQ